MSNKSNKYFIINKPYKVLSQFSHEGNNPGLGSVFNFPKDVYPVGRLDLDSEGLLIVTNDKSLNNNLLNPVNEHVRTYRIEVDGNVKKASIKELESGVDINLKGKTHRTKSCKVKVIPTPDIAEREPSVNRVKHPVTTWLEIKLTEGKNRQVRRMSAKVGHPTLRLIRIAIEDVQLGDIEAGAFIELSRNAIYRKLKLN